MTANQGEQDDLYLVAAAVPLTFQLGLYGTYAKLLEDTRSISFITVKYI